MEKKTEFIGYINVYPTGLSQLSTTKECADRRTVDSGKIGTLKVYYNHETKECTAEMIPQ